MLEDKALALAQQLAIGAERQRTSLVVASFLIANTPCTLIHLHSTPCSTGLQDELDLVQVLTYIKGWSQ